MALSNSALKSLIRNWDFDTLPFEGSHIRTAFYKTTKPTHGHVLMLHGRGEFIELMTEDAADWARRGYQPIAFDFPGQGASGRFIADKHKSHVSDFRTYTDALQLVESRVWRPALQGGHGIVSGHSTGAHIALRHLVEADGLVVSSPMIALKLGTGVARTIKEGIVALHGKIAPESYAIGQKPNIPSQRPFEGNKHTNNRERYEQWQMLREEYPQHLTGGATAGWAYAALRSCTLLERELPHIKIPMLALITPDDPVVDGPAQRRLEQAERISFPGEKHVLAQADDTILAHTSFLKDCFAARLRTGRNTAGLL